MAIRNTHQLSVAAALAGALSLVAVSLPAAAADMKTANEKCYGISAAGENNCAIAGFHTCAGMTKANYSGKDFKEVAAGTCTKLGGKLAPFEGTGKAPSKS